MGGHAGECAIENLQHMSGMFVQNNRVMTWASRHSAVQPAMWKVAASVQDSIMFRQAEKLKNLF